MQTTIRVPLAKLRTLQELVKQHDLRFLGPVDLGPVTWVTLSSDHLPPGACTQFHLDWCRANRSITEVTPTPWNKFYRAVRGRLLKVYNT